MRNQKLTKLAVESASPMYSTLKVGIGATESSAVPCNPVCVQDRQRCTLDGALRNWPVQFVPEIS